MATSASPGMRTTTQRRNHAEVLPVRIDADDERKDERRAVSGWRRHIGHRLLAVGACAFCLKLALTAWLVRFASSRCFHIDWYAALRLYSVPAVRDQQGLDGFIRRQEPALLLDALRGWPAVGKWSPEWFGTRR